MTDYKATKEHVGTPAIYQILRIEQAAAGDMRLPMQGQFFAVIDSFYPDAKIDVRFDDPVGKLFTFRKGDFIRAPFAVLHLEWVYGGLGSWVDVIISARENFEFNRAKRVRRIMSAPSVQIMVIAVATQLVYVAGTPGGIWENYTTGGVILMNCGTKDCYLSSSSVVGSATGLPLKAGSSLSLDDYTGELYAACGGADNTTVAVMRLIAGN